MTIAITAVSSVANPDSAIGATTERQLSDFAGQLQGNALGSMPRLGNPAALAGQLLGDARGYVDRLQKMSDRASRAKAPDLHGGPARENLESRDREGAAAPPSGDQSVALARQAMEAGLAEMSFLVGQSYIVSGTSAASHSASSLLRGSE
jgi:hypothetical protein